MRPHDGTHSAAARGARIRRAHDMEATWLDSMHRRSDLVETPGRPGILSRMLRRTRTGTSRAEPLREAAPE
ncbi:MAG: hypothetical protein QOF27_903 [Gaiellaceae bacterium]|jgi:hypothetical protein|nr:hypothetical protein [Gaiellaceae bacterium]